MAEERAAVWVLLGKRKGDNAQVLALADALGVPYRAVTLHYNALRLVPPALLGASLASLTQQSRDALNGRLPDLVVGIGHRSVPASLAIRRRSGGRARLVRLGNPRVHPCRFNLVVTTPQYAVPDAPNVVRLPLAITTDRREEPSTDERQWLAELPRPHRLLILGGPTFMWKLGRADVERAAKELCGRCERDGGSLIAVPSPRTPAAISIALARRVQGPGLRFVESGSPRYLVLLDDADEIHVTDESVSMMSEAMMTGKPVHLVATRRTLIGSLLYAWAGLTGSNVPVRDLVRFRSNLKSATQVPDPLSTAVAAVREVLGRSAR